VKIYTRSGDQGQTSLFGGTRVSKDDPRIEAYGTIDELNSVIGLARATWPVSPIDGELQRVQGDLFEIGAHLASPGGSRFEGVPPKRVEELERGIDAAEEQLSTLTSFILPGGTIPAATLHLARTVCRRAERLVVALQEDSAAARTTIVYLNRLSDFLFVSARLANALERVGDVPWSRGQ